MSRRNWKRLQPTSLRHALELCKDHARERRNLSVERIADEMGITDHWSLYKWIQSGRFPANLIRPYETVCGIDFATRWLVASAGRLVVDIPSGRNASATDINGLQAVLNDAVGALIGFYAGRAQVDETLGSLQAALETLAAHRGNVVKHAQPELDFAGEAE